MKATFVYIFLVWLGFLLQTTSVPYSFHLLAQGLGFAFLEELTIEISFIGLAYLALHRDLWSALSWSVFVGLVARWFGLGWPGCLAIAFFATTLGCVFGRKNLLITSSGSIMMFVFVLSLVQGFIQLQSVTWIYHVSGAFRMHAGTWFLQACLNALFAPLIFEILNKLDDVMGIRGFIGSRRTLAGL